MPEAFPEQGPGDGQFDTIVDKHQPPQVISHFSQSFDETDHQFPPQFIVPGPHPVRSDEHQRLPGFFPVIGVRDFHHGFTAYSGIVFLF